MTSRFKNSKEFFDTVKEIHDNKYSYGDEIYKRLNSKIAIVCPHHGEFWQVAHDHLRGYGCRKCCNDSKKTWSNEQDEFLKQNYHKGAFWCATQLDKSEHGVRGRAAKLGITNKQLKINKNIPASFWKNVQVRIKEGGFDYDIDSDFIWELYQKQDGRCALTNKPIKFALKEKSKYTTVSLDRIDSKLGYTKDNLQLTHKIVNRCKLNCPEEVFFAICKDIYFNMREKYEKYEIEWEIDAWNDREVPKRKINSVNYENMNMADFKRDKA